MIFVAGGALVDFTQANCRGHSRDLPHPGGSPYNVAIGLRRFEVPVAFLGRISRHSLGELPCSHREAGRRSPARTQARTHPGGRR